MTSKQRVRIALIKLNKDQRWLAAQLGLSEASVTRILDGDRSASKLVREKVHELLGVWLPKKSEAA